MSTHTGRAAEDAAAVFLRGQGFDLLAQNWRTRWCEIDIVAKRQTCVYFVEVKYRSSTAWGGGLEYITPRKVRQMRFAAAFWLTKYKADSDYKLAAIELTDSPPQVAAWVDDIY